MKSPNISKEFEENTGMKQSEMQRELLSNCKICNFDDKIKVISMLSETPRDENIRRMEIYLQALLASAL